MQGREFDITILSLVRAPMMRGQSEGKHGLGFVRDPERFNVSATRAKLALWTLGHFTTLQQELVQKEEDKCAFLASFAAVCA